jgi:hypothetical protein
VLLRSWATSLVSPLLSSLALGAVGVASLDHPASPPVASRLPTTKRGKSCPLPVGKQLKAVQAFGEMMPVFRHPRCFNCHGGFDITSDEHEGSDFVKNTGLDPRALLTAQQRKELHEGCAACHDNIRGTLTRLDGTQLAGWLVAPLPMLWNGKSDEQLCLDMKRFERDGAQFIDHMETDHNEIQFIEAAFNGDRALGAALKDYDLVIEKPPGTQAELIAKARKWVATMGAESQWVGSPECGCVKPKIKLEVHHTTVSEVPNGLPSKEASEVKFEVDLVAQDEEQRPNMYAGEFSLKRVVQMTLPKFCKGSASRQERWVFYASFNPETDAMTLWRFLYPEEPKGGIECKHGTGKANTGIFPGTPVSMLGIGEPLVMPADSGSRKELNEVDGGDRERLTITVLEVPATQ